MGADRAPDVGVGHGEGVGRLEGRELVADVDHQADAGRAGAGDHRVAVLVELRRVQVDVAVDQHRPSGRAACAPGRPGRRPGRRRGRGSCASTSRGQPAAGGSTARPSARRPARLRSSGRGLAPAAASRSNSRSRTAPAPRRRGTCRRCASASAASTAAARRPSARASGRPPASRRRPAPGPRPGAPPAMPARRSAPRRGPRRSGRATRSASGLRRPGREGQPAAARADGRQQPARRMGDQEQHAARRRLLQSLQHGVGGVDVQVVGGVDDRHAVRRAGRATWRRTPAGRGPRRPGSTSCVLPSSPSRSSTSRSGWDWADDLAADRIVGRGAQQAARRIGRARPAAGARRDRRRSPCPTPSGPVSSQAWCSRPRARASRKAASAAASGDQVEDVARMRAHSQDRSRLTARPDARPRPRPIARRRRSRAQRSGSAAAMARKPSRSRSWKASPLDSNRVSAPAAPKRALQARPRPAGRRSGSGPAGSRPGWRLQRRDQGRRRAAAGALIGAGGIGEAVADHPGAARQRRADRPLQVVARARRTSAGSRCTGDQRSASPFRTRCRGCSSAPGEPPGSRVWHDLDAARASGAAARRRDLGGLPGPLAAFEGDESAAGHRRTMATRTAGAKGKRSNAPISTGRRRIRGDDRPGGPVRRRWRRATAPSERGTAPLVAAGPGRCGAIGPAASATCSGLPRIREGARPGSSTAGAIGRDAAGSASACGDRDATGGGRCVLQRRPAAQTRRAPEIAHPHLAHAPRCSMPSASAAPRDRSMIRSSTNGPRSLTRSTIRRPLARLVTSTRPGSGRVLWAAVRACMSNRSPRRRRSPLNWSPYQEASPTSS